MTKLPATVRLTWRHPVMIIHTEGQAPHLAIELGEDSTAILEELQSIYEDARIVPGDNDGEKLELGNTVRVRWTSRSYTFRFYTQGKANPNFEVIQSRKTKALRSMIESAFDRARPVDDVIDDVAAEGERMADAFMEATKEEPDDNVFVGSLNGEDV